MEIEHPTLEELLAEAAFARRLALALTGDAAEADDLVQEALAAGAARRPEIRRTARGWIAGTIRNLVRSGRRAAGRRRRREAVAARPEALPSAAENAARAEVLERVARAVRALDEPCRSAVLHRYYDGLPPREIARRTGVPLTTVKSRLRRGLAALRSRLDSGVGGRRRWSALLLPIASGATKGKAAAAAGVGVMAGKKTVAIAAVLFAVAGGLLWFGPGGRHRDRPAEPSSVAATPADAAAPASEEGSDPSESPVVAAGAREQEARLRGRVVGPTGVPVAGASLRLRPPSPADDGIVHVITAYADEGGRFSLPLLPEGELKVDHPAYVPRVLSVAGLGPDTEILLDAGLAVTGRVAFPGDRPVPGVRISAQGRHTRTGEDGRYRLTGLRPGRVSVECEVAGAVAANAGDEDVDFTPRSHVIRVRATDEAGRPLDEAHCSIWWQADGSRHGFTGSLDTENGDVLDVPATRVGITVSSPGLAEGVRVLEIDGTPRLHEVRLVLSPAPAPGRLEIHAAREDGRPLRRAWVWVWNEAYSPAGAYADAVELSPEGVATLDDLPPGPRTVEVAGTDVFSRDGYVLAAKAEVEVRSGETTEVVLTLPVGGRVRVTVRDDEGETVVPGRIDLLDDEGRRVWTCFLQDLEGDGFTTALERPLPALIGRPVPPGLYRVRVRRDGADPVVGEPFPIHAGETAEVSLRVSE